MSSPALQPGAPLRNPYSTASSSPWKPNGPSHQIDRRHLDPVPRIPPLGIRGAETAREMDHVGCDAGLLRCAGLAGPGRLLPGDRSGRTRVELGASRMFDLAMIALGSGAFAILILYTYACDRM